MRIPRLRNSALNRGGLLAAAFLVLAVPAGAKSAADPATLWKGLAEPRFDSSLVAVAENVRLERDAATLVLNGTLAFGRPGLPESTAEAAVVFAVFRGSGRLQLAPTLPLERQQLALHSGDRSLDTEFTQAVFVFTDDTYLELEPQLSFNQADPGSLPAVLEMRQKHWKRYGRGWLTRVLKALLSEQPDPHALLVAELETKKHGWLTFIADAADPEEIELHKLDTGKRSVTYWTKFPADGRRPEEVFAEPLARHEYVVEHYALDVTAEKNAYLRVAADVKVGMRRGGERVLLLALDPNLRVTQVSDERGQALAFFQPEDPKDHFFLGDYLAVVSPTPFPAESQTLHFQFAGKRIIRKVGSGNYFCQSFGWYPHYGLGRDSIGLSEFAARIPFDITLRVPKKFDAVAVGHKVAEREEGDYKITQWKSELPLAVAGFAFGEYKIVTRKRGETEVQVFANKKPDDMFRALPQIPIGRLRDPTEIAPVLLALRSINPGNVAREMAVEVDNALKVMEHFFGPYPYQKIAVTNIPYSYGQGWPSLLYISMLSFLDSTQRNALGLTDSVELNDTFRAHEASHQWWGHMVGWKSYHDQWLSEGFAEFSGMLYALYRRKPDEYRRLLREGKQRLLEREPGRARYEELGPLSAGHRLSTADQPRAYSVVIYEKGAWVLHMLRMMLFDPQNPKNPDARFIAMMQDFTRSYYNQAASTADFKKIVEKHMLPHMDLDANGTMDWFFDSWVHGTGIPEYKLDYRVEPAPDGGAFILRGSLRQSGVPETFRTIVPLFLHKGDGFIRAGWLRVRGPETPFETKLPFKPDKLTLNEAQDVLCKIK